MAQNINSKDLLEFLEKGYEILEQRKDYVEIPALKEGERSMKQRIHNKGLDSDGIRIGMKASRAGKYSKGYEKRKEKIVGAQNLYPINLQLRGDLLKGYTVGQQSGQNVLEFQDDFSRNKAAWNEENFNTEIFRHSEQELEDIKEVWLLQFEDVMNEAFGSL